MHPERPRRGERYLRGARASSAFRSFARFRCAQPVAAGLLRHCLRFSVPFQCSICLHFGSFDVQFRRPQILLEVLLVCLLLRLDLLEGILQVLSLPSKDVRLL